MLAHFQLVTPLFRSLLPLALLLASCGGPPPAPATPPDTTPPQLTASAPTVDGKTVTLQVRVTDHNAVSHLTYALDDGDVSSLLLTGEGPEYPLTVHDVRPGKHRLTLIAYDAAGNASQTVTLTFEAADTTPPDPVRLSASRSTVEDLEPVTLTATTQDDVGVTRVMFYQGETLLGTDDTPADGFTWTKSFIQADNGSFRVHAVAADAAGNLSEPGADLGLSVNVGLNPNGPDLIAPVILATSQVRTDLWFRDERFRAGGLTVFSGREPQVEVNTQDDRGVVTLEYRLDGGSNLSSVSGGIAPSASFPLPSLALGPHVLTVWALDAAGNRSAPLDLPYTLSDIVAPTFHALTVQQREGRGQTYHVQLTADASDDQGVTSFTVFLGDDAERTLPVSGPGPYTLDLGYLPLGRQNLRVWATDASGLVSGRDEDVDVRDVDPPAAPKLQPEKLSADGLTPVNFTVSGGADNIGVVAYQLLQDGRVVDTLNLSGRSSVTFTATVPNTQPSATYQAVALDAAGNVGPPSTPVTVAITVRDLTPPNPPRLTITPDDTLNTGQQVTLTAIADPDVVRAEFMQSDIFWGNEIIIGTDTTPADGLTWTGLTPTNQKIVWYTVRVYDAAGNFSQGKLWSELTDVMGPSITITWLQKPGTTRMEFHFDIKDHSELLGSTVSLLGGQGYPLSGDTLFVDGLDPGTYPISVEAEDIFHNRSTKTAMFTVTAP